MASMRGGSVAENSTVWRSVRRGPEDRLDVLGEAHVEHLVGLVEHDDADAVEPQRAAIDVVDRPARRGDDDVDAVAQGAELAADRLAAVDRQDPHAELAPVAVHRLGHLHGELAGRHQHEGDGLRRRTVGSTSCSAGRANAAVLPVPVAACPSTSWPASSGGMASRWIGVGSS